MERGVLGAVGRGGGPWKVSRLFFVLVCICTNLFSYSYPPRLPPQDGRAISKGGDRCSLSFFCRPSFSACLTIPFVCLSFYRDTKMTRSFARGSSASSRPSSDGSSAPRPSSRGLRATSSVVSVGALQPSQWQKGWHAIANNGRGIGKLL